MNALCSFREAREIAFIDAAVADRNTIADFLRRDVEEVFLGDGDDAGGQIASALSRCGSVETIHIVAHGRPGEDRLA